jgi:patatin-like phospholipase/acyl hydrolase
MPEVEAELHSKRDQHLFGPGPKRLLALDGGGVRGAISVAFLEHIEHLVWERKGREIRLGDWFDLIGGTSTGAIIAGALALGHTTRELEQFYRQRAHLVFRSSLRIPGLQARFNAKALSAEIERVVGDKTLDDPELITGFALMAKRMDTGSPWLISNNPRAPYWDARPGRTAIPNRKYRLANLVRASTAAPFYFDPELISIHENEPSGLFIDGGVTPYNDHSFHRNRQLSAQGQARASRLHATHKSCLPGVEFVD